MTNDILWDTFEYCPLTGDLIWRNPPPKKSQLKGKVAGCKAHRGYRFIRFQRTNLYQHRLVWQWVHGNEPSKTIDHIDRDTSNNRVTNLRDVSGKVQCENRSHNGWYPRPKYGNK